MPFSSDQRQTGPSPWLVILLCAIYLFSGLIDHDPWKVDDALHLSIAQGMAKGGNWLVPAVAGEPWPEAEPLYHWVAATTARLAEPLLAFPAGARLATALFAALFLAFLASASRRFYNGAAGWGAPLLAIGTLGLLVPLHEAQPASAILASTAAVYWGCALLTSHALSGALLLGAGIGAGFLAGGLNAALPLLPLLAAPLLLRRWLALLVGGTTTLIVCGTWLLLLFRQSPAFLSAWWSTELASIAPRGGFTLVHLEWLSWFAWPVAFLALWALWSGRRQLSTPAYALPLLGAVAAAGWFLSHEPRPPVALPLLPPLMLLGAASLSQLKRGAANAWDWFGMMTFSLVVGLIWLGTLAMLSGWPPKIAHNFAKLEPGFVAPFSLPALAVAAVATGLWLLVLLRLPRSPWRVATRWAAGLAIMWALLTALWMPWIDYGKTYRPVIASLARALPTDHGCIGRRDLGPAQRALLDHFGGIRTQPATNGCTWLISQGGPNERPPAGWSLVWEGHRPGDRSERLRLYRRQ
jgi:4-amino-4-deoxy-L-arabinose transferase-like glycosyltransferase